MMPEPNAANIAPDEVLASPTKALFVEMLTKDLPLDLAVTDLVDNSVDGARRIRRDEQSLQGLRITVSLSSEEFSIVDNCGGIPIPLAKSRAFRFGRTRDAEPTPHSVGQFGVGMKRALFKFGRYFEVRSVSPTDRFFLKVDVDDWEDEEKPWTFKFEESNENEQNPIGETGTTIIVRRLREDAANNFGREDFINTLIRTIQQAQQEYIERGLEIVCADRHLVAIPWTVLEGRGIGSGYWEHTARFNEREPIYIRVCVGVSESNPRQAGWYVSCNGRIVLSADQTERTGWNQTAETTTSPKYHNQFARFRGFVFFDSADASQLPWNTTKDDIDIDAAVYQLAVRQMIAMMRPVINFLNAVDAENEEAGVGTPLKDALDGAEARAVRDVRRTANFASPRGVTGPQMAHITFSKERGKVLELQAALNAANYKDVGVRAFDLAYEAYVEPD